jgi:hypothetical protein
MSTAETSKATREIQPDKKVKITLDASGLPIPEEDPIPIYRDRQKIHWYADFDFSIDIDDYKDVQHGREGSSAFAKTGHFTGAAGTRHKYSITANGITHDPDIDIKP